MHRSAPRLSRILACAAVPVMLVAAGCSSDSGSGSEAEKSAGSSSSAAAEPTKPAVEPAKFTDLPDACSSIGKKTIEDLVPDAKKKGGTAGRSSDLSVRGSCSWNGLEDKGVKGSQYRWLSVSFTRFDSDQSLGSGAARANEDYTKQVAKEKASEGAQKVAAAAAPGIGDEATAVTYGLNKTDEDFEYATVVARTGNVVVTLTYNGAGFAGAKTPSAADILKGAQKAAKEAVGKVDATGGSGSAEATPSAGDAKKDESKKDDKKGDEKPESEATPKS
ncbi:MULTISPECIES: DUF3558 domain-containing protein [unclassified Streptomyces]|uniref:DUF3558 domain-containing protein n=1 Tax=unclassified Streptomyces TaxID=2593676 RepID=UPI00081E819B|nr:MULTISPECIES: DUF3558 domain-containing protein [unclassified Streptomyces]MYR95963.1 DUF3558 domain-containing protein [Streptomyces sp. SID4937]SCE00418.1 hypothetical protein GA0115243_1056108 [Streptomyces sp. ScaeMP-e83]